MEIKRTYRERREKLNTLEKESNPLRMLGIYAIATAMLLFGGGALYGKGVKENENLRWRYDLMNESQRKELVSMGIENPYERSKFNLALDGLGCFADSALNRIRK